MPEVKCPITDCEYKTPDLEASIVTVLLDAHCRTHNSTSDTNLSSSSTNNSNDQNMTVQSGQCLPNHKIQNRGRIGLVVSLVLCILTLILDVALAFVPQLWYKREEQLPFGNITTTVGLWRGCVVTETAIGIAEQCWDHGEKNFPFNYMFVGAAQVFQCLGVIFMTCAIIAIIVKLTIAKEEGSVVDFAGMYAIWAGVFFAGSSGVVAPGLKQISTQDIDYTEDVGLSSGVVCLNAVVALIGGIVLLVNKYVTSEMTKNYRRMPAYKRMKDEDINL